MTPGTPPSDDATPTATRRTVLAAAGSAGLAATGGCVQRARSLFARDRDRQLELTIKTLPTDADPWAIRTASHLAEQLRAVGIGTQVVPTSRITLLRDVLVNQSFDLYVARLPAFDDADFLRALLHSRFGAEPGWQNPFGYANLAVDQLLEEQRRQAGKRRQETLVDVQEAVVRDQPFSVVAFPDEIRAVRTDRVTGWSSHRIHTPLGYLALAPREGEFLEAEPTLKMTLTDSRAPENLNPIAVEYRSSGTITDLLYDSLGRRIDGSVRPWMAESWRWRDVSADGPTLDVTLRDGLEWHDGEPITAHDVEFTYRFLQDTSLGAFQSPLPAPRFRGRTSLVSSVQAFDDETVRVQFGPASRPVALRALTVPVLPAHVWRTRTSRATIAGFDPGRSVTEALIWNNRNPVGSGPLAFESSTRRESVVLSRYDDHFLGRDGLPDYLSPYRGGFSFGRLKFLVAPSGDTAVELVSEGSADATASGVTPSAVPRIGRTEALTLHTEPSLSAYHVGFNIRKAPYGNPRFRRAVAHLLDQDYLVREVFDGYAVPAVSPLARHESLAPSLAWKGEDPGLAFPGENGQLNVERARDLFRKAGYRFSTDGKLLVS